MPRTLLFSPDTIHGHIIEDGPQGPLYRDDGSLVDEQPPRACFKCKLMIAPGAHDPCIANLPKTVNACCGHGLDRTPHKNLSGYVGLESGKIFRFSGLVDAEQIRAAVSAAIKGEALPEGFIYDELPWWHGLSAEQRSYVQERIPAALQKRVQEVKRGEPLSAAYLRGEAMWWDGLSPEQKDEVWNSLSDIIADLVIESQSRRSC
ncbi:MAG: hypothetical protein K2X27_11515 [Candidatus Obscuribacterales bacterium]|nr:hypothetical protein [Candidatus Obscuribacterales bacterium]